MINIKIKPEERISMECYFLMRELLTQYHRVGKKNQFVFDVTKVGPYEISNLELFSDKNDVHDLLDSMSERQLIERESYSRPFALDPWGGPPDTYKITILEAFYPIYDAYEKDVIGLSKSQDKLKGYYNYGDIILDMNKATLSFKNNSANISTEKREIKFLEKLMQKDGLVADYLELAEHMNLQSFTKISNNMDVARDVQDVKKSLDDYLKQLFDLNTAKEMIKFIQNVNKRGYKLKIL